MRVCDSPAWPLVVATNACCYHCRLPRPNATAVAAVLGASHATTTQGSSTRCKGSRTNNIRSITDYDEATCLGEGGFGCVLWRVSSRARLNQEQHGLAEPAAALLGDAMARRRKGTDASSQERKGDRAVVGGEAC